MQECDGGVKHNTTLATIFDSGVNLIKVDEIGANVMDIVVRGLVKVFLAQ